MSTKVLHQYCASAIAVLNSQYQASQLVLHGSSVGLIREHILKDFLTTHLPEMVAVVSGQIFDSNNNYSKQQDVVLILKSMPRMPFASGVNLIFQEGVVASIEIKTKLDSTKLREIGANFQSVRALANNVICVGAAGVVGNWPAEKILTAIISYEGMTLASIQDTLESFEESARPDLVLDLSKGLLVRNHGLLCEEKPGHVYLTVDDPAAGFKHFLTFLTQVTGKVLARGVDWTRYW